VTHVPHFRFEEHLWAYGPYVRELEVWAELFPQLLLAAPCRAERPPADCLAIRRGDVRIAPVRETGGMTIGAKIQQLLAVPQLVWQVSRAMHSADAIHVRCPGNLGLLGVVLAPLFSRMLVAKYAGQWNGYRGEARTYRWQRAVLRSSWWRGPVTVYGDWPHQPAHVVPFFTTALTDDQIERARRTAAARDFGKPLRALFVGRLSAAKHVDKLISAIAELRTRGIHLECSIVGEGPERAKLAQQVSRLGLADCVQLCGGRKFDEVLEHYEQSDILVLASETEGWPKAILEGLAFGLICVGSQQGFVPHMLGEGRGITVAPGDASELARVLEEIAVAPERFREMGRRGATWAERYSLNGLREALRDLLIEHWNVEFPDSPSNIYASPTGVCL
jgi:glycosyltransferase involved in cell wall biosynthesis